MRNRSERGDRRAGGRHRSYLRLITFTAAALLLPATPAFAHSDAPAGGASAEEVIVASIVGALFVILAVLLVVVRRKGRIELMDRVGRWAEDVSGVPGWAVVPIAVAGVSLVIAVFGFYWDVATHIDHGRDESVFGNPAHWPILVGLVGIAVAGMLSLLLGAWEERPGAFELKNGWQVPIGGVLLVVCGLIALAGFPIDDVWHRIFGQDVTLWSPPHIQMVAGASLSTIALWILFVEAQRAAPEQMSGRRHRWMEIALAGAVLIGMSTLQGEFDYGVPQFNQLFHPTLIAIAAGIALVPARTRLGRGGAFLAVGFFLVVRGLTTFFVTGVFDLLPFHLPLYLGAAIAVELVARFVPTSRQLSFGAAAGLAIGTVGLGLETVWTHVAMPHPWTAALLPEALYIAIPAAVAAGLVGGFLARALAAPRAPRQSVPAIVAPIAGLTIVAALVYCLPTTGSDAVAHITLEEVEADDGLRAHATIEIEPSDAAEDARWFQILSWQGADWWSEQHSEIHDLEDVGDGTYRTTRPVPIHGNWKSMVRLHDGRVLVAAPIFLPEDEAIPVEEVPAEPEMTREFVSDEEILLREMRPAPAWIETTAHAGMGLIALAWIAVFIWGTRRLRLAAPHERGAGSTEARGLETAGR